MQFVFDVNEVLKRVEVGRGESNCKKRLIVEDIGYMGACIDTEGNRIAVHSKKI